MRPHSLVPTGNTGALLPGQLLVAQCYQKKSSQHSPFRSRVNAELSCTSLEQMAYSVYHRTQEKPTYRKKFIDRSFMTYVIELR